MERHTSFDDLSELYESLLHYLEKIESNNDPENRFNPKSVNEASGIRKQLKSSSFIVAFQTCHYAYGYTKGLSKQLQGSTIAIAKAYDMVSLVTDQLQAVRDNANEEFNSIFKKCHEMVEQNGKTLDTPRIVSRRSNVESNTPEEYYRRSIFIPFIDAL